MGTDAIDIMKLSAEEEQQMMADDETETPVEQAEPEATEEPAPVETTKQEPAPVVEEKPVEQKMVPLAALAEARREMREMREQMEFLKKVKAEVDELKAPKAPPVPQFEEDPLGNLNHRIEQAQSIQKQQEAILRQYEEGQKRQMMAHHVTALEHEFRTKNPDYDKALEYVINIKKGELEDMGISDPMVIEDAIKQTASGLSMGAIQQGKNPAEVVYSLAKRYGYRNEPVTPAVPKIEQIAHAQKVAGKTLPKGGDADINVNATTLANEKFSIYDPGFEKKWKELFGEE